MMSEGKLVTVFVNRDDPEYKTLGRFKRITLEEFRKTVDVGEVFNAHVYFNWSAQNGSGQLSFYLDPNTQRFNVSNECMDRDVVRQLLYALIDKIVDEGDFDCESNTS